MDKINTPGFSNHFELSEVIKGKGNCFLIWQTIYYDINFVFIFKVIIINPSIIFSFASPLLERILGPHEKPLEEKQGWTAKGWTGKKLDDPDYRFMLVFKHDSIKALAELQKSPGYTVCVCACVRACAMEVRLSLHACVVWMYGVWYMEYFIYLYCIMY